MLTRMAFAFRVLLAFFGAIAAFYLTLGVGGALIVGFGLSGASAVAWLAPPLGAVAAFGAARFVWRRLGDSSSVLGAAATGALVTGSIAFGAGFFGPMIFAPDANQGPLLGILITGPLGFVLGGIGGAVYGTIRRRRLQPSSGA